MACAVYAPDDGGTKYQKMFRAPAGEGELWKRVLRRAASEDEARLILVQAEAALDSEQAMPVGADVRASRTIRMIGEEYLSDSIERGKQPRTLEQRVSRPNAHILPTIGDLPVTKWRVEHSRLVMDKGGRTLFSQRGREDLRGQLSAMRRLAWRLGWLDRSIDPLDGLEIGRANVLHGATAHYVDPRLRPETRKVRAGAVDRDGVVEVVLVRLGACHSAWNAADARGEVERTIASSGGAVDDAVRRELAEDLTARVIASRPLLGRTDVPEHVRSFTSSEVLAVEHEVVHRITARAAEGSITVIKGAAGAGKTARLAATRERALAAGHRMVVVTPTRKAAQVAEGALGAASYSAAWLLHQHGIRWDEDGRWTRVTASPDVAARMRTGDLLVVDEAGMVDQDTARALLRLVDEVRAQLVLVGDRHQLPAVGRGGVLDLAVRNAPERLTQLDGARRFADPGYAELSLRMRKGQRPGEVFDELVRSGEIVVHASDVERTRRLAAEAEIGELVVADTWDEVARINALAHRARTTRGEVTDGIVTAAGQDIGTGDRIATRRDDLDADAANRETWTVVSCDGGALTLRGDSGARVLPPAYVRQHVELAYATTAYGAQGCTVPVSHVLVGEHTGAASAYAGMTRGLKRNVAHLVAGSVEEARKQWCDVFSRDRADLGPTHAREVAAEAIDRYGSTKPRYTRRPAPSAPRVGYEIDYRPPVLSPGGHGLRL